MSIAQRAETPAALAGQPRQGRSHEWVDRRSLALDVEIAKTLRERPELLNKAKETLERWISQRQPDVPRVMLEWREILEKRSFDEILVLLSSFDEEARRLRQSSPFCGILPANRRLEIFKRYEALRA